MNHQHNSYPKLRPLDIRAIEHQGRPSLLVRDRLELAGQYLILPYALGPVLFLCDGHHAIGTIPELCLSQFGVRLQAGVVEELVTALDRAYFLDNEHSAEAMAIALQQYRSAPYRPPTLAGSGYPAEAEALAQLFDGYLAEVGDITPLPATGRALFSPHIDYARGGTVYAQVWKRAAAMAQAADLVIVLATNHYGGMHEITLTRQHYATPYGVLPTATDIVDSLAQSLGTERVFAGELYHRPEHSIELVLSWLHHMRGGRPVEVVPILTGSFQPCLEQGSEPISEPIYQQLLGELRRLSQHRQVLVVASGDMAHIGPAFDGDPVDEAGRMALQAADEELISLLAAGDADGFWRSIQRVQDRNNVCGVSPFYLTLKLVGTVSGERSGYAICPADEKNTSVVSVCGIVYG
ncbi:MAG: AmmeMemoRadiSam system protein B [Chloroflexi bacterium]|nr:AmmeMemoRadiSam system protein B [Chloroflexota bacterium]